MVDIYKDVKCLGVYLVLGTDPNGDSCSSIYQNNGIEMHFVFKETVQCKPFFLFLACTLPVILTNLSQNQLSIDNQSPFKWKWIVGDIYRAAKLWQRWIIVLIYTTQNWITSGPKSNFICDILKLKQNRKPSCFSSAACRWVVIG